jgi:hypothetical protein
MAIPDSAEEGELLQRLRETSIDLYNHDPHNPLLYLQRGHIHARLGFPDLAAADAYRALTLLESVIDPDGSEYLARRRIQRDVKDNGIDGDADADVDDDEDFVETSRAEYDSSIGDVYSLLVQSLFRCGCVRDAYEFCARGIEHLVSFDGDEEPDLYRTAVVRLQTQLDRIKEQRRVQTGRNDFDAGALPVQGFARRVLYPWNTHEPDRKAPETLALLNERMHSVAPRCEVRAVALPALHDGANSDENVSIQLGLFAKENLAPGETILRESSLLTATNRLHDDLCDACNGPLPSLSSDHHPDRAAVACQGCDDTVFCSATCHDRAQDVYHAAICGHEGVESIGKDVADPSDKADYLYLLLIGRAIAMAATQDVHPLDLPEVKYIWGDFHDYRPVQDADDGGEDASLPFSFQLNILQPTRLLEEMGLDPFACLERYDTWVVNTLYAKFRGTASGRLSTWDGGPEVCAVHPLWCLANHSCDPNVRWEWGGEVAFMVRTVDEKPLWRRKATGEERHTRDTQGIGKDEEILNHYCDVGLDVKQRREWAKGALGGLCLCSRCRWEADASK